MKHCQEWRCRELRRRISVQIRGIRKQIRKTRVDPNKWNHDFNCLYFTAQINILQLLVGRGNVLIRLPEWMKYSTMLSYNERKEEDRNAKAPVADVVA